MEKVKFWFRVVGDRGQVRRYVRMFEVPVFEEIPQPEEFSELDLPNVSVDQQRVMWMDEVDKTDLMHDNEWYVILDYGVVKSEKWKKKKVN